MGSASGKDYHRHQVCQAIETASENLKKMLEKLKEGLEVIEEPIIEEMRQEEAYSPASIYDSLVLGADKLNTINIIEKLILHIRLIELKILKSEETLDSRAKKIAFFIENEICLTGIFRANEALRYPGWVQGNNLIDIFFLGLESKINLDNKKIEPQLSNFLGLTSSNSNLAKLISYLKYLKESKGLTGK